MVWNNWISTLKNLDIKLIYFTNIDSKWIIDLNVKCNTIKLLKYNIEENLEDLGFGDNFLINIKV